ncbi:MAG: GNAT family N-acetyltransferase [Candidatus Bathyarchaeota archaeon]|nr:GNAT family N-acetyltransferase [Candidatus Bathyarchaeota archaeon]
MTKIEILETQQESELDDETLFTLFIDGQIASWAKTTLYSNLEDIHTACLEKRKGYGRLLLAFIEKTARDHCATSMRTSNFDACNDEATKFFTNGGYAINPSISGLSTSVKATKFFSKRWISDE